ncbi:MAG: hypothetical protein LUC86_02290, partial [Prevotellaceae bacterium]|nr:hypothetical protein [Prevotellaceae bacterium]
MERLRRIVYIVAMEAEAEPLIERYQLKERKGAFAPLPCRLFEGRAGEAELFVALNGRQHERDLVGCEAATLTTIEAVRLLRPELLINSGTCGAFRSRGAEIGKVYIGSGAMFHDRRVPGDDQWGTQSVGNYPVWQGSKELADGLGLPMAKVTTGSSLDMQPCDLSVIREHGGELKDMEGAAVGLVGELTGVPVLYVQA